MMPSSTRHPDASHQPMYGLARVLSKRGYCSRKKAEALVREGRVTVDGHRVTDPERRTDPASADIAVDGRTVAPERPVYIMLNKPRGLVTTAEDPQGRATVFACLEGLGLPHVAPVGRLDKASEGLLLFTNDTVWANAVLDGPDAPRKTYHVKIDRRPNDALLAALCRGVTEAGEHLSAVSACVLREADRSAWLEIVLSEGRNRHIRRLLAAHDIETLRLVRVAIGSLALGDLAKGASRSLTETETQALAARNY